MKDEVVGMWSPVKSKAPDEAGIGRLRPVRKRRHFPRPARSVGAALARLRRDTFVLDAQPAGMGLLVGAQRGGSPAPDDLPAAHQAHLIGKAQGEVQILLDQQNG